MTEKNQHKFLAKASVCSKSLLPHDDYNRELSLNFSRTIGNSKNWIGCGFLNKTGVETDHIDTKFPFYSLVYVVNGKGRYIDESGKTYSLRAGSIFQRQPWVKHTTLIDPQSGWKEYYLDCNEELYEHLSAMLLIQRDVPVYKSDLMSPISAELESLMELLKKGTEEEVFDAYLSYLNILRSLFTHQSEEIIPDNMIKKCLDDFEQRYATRFDLKEYCQENGWGYETFRKAFKKHLGVSPREYLIRKRMDEACRLLRATGMRISEISAELGYASQYEFSNQFNRYYNVAPKHYRQGV